MLHETKVILVLDQDAKLELSSSCMQKAVEERLLVLSLAARRLPQVIV